MWELKLLGDVDAPPIRGGIATKEAAVLLFLFAISYFIPISLFCSLFINNQFPHHQQPSWRDYMVNQTVIFQDWHVFHLEIKCPGEPKTCNPSSSNRCNLPLLPKHPQVCHVYLLLLLLLLLYILLPGQQTDVLI